MIWSTACEKFLWTLTPGHAGFPGYLIWQVPKYWPRAFRGSEQMDALSSTWIRLVSSDGGQRIRSTSNLPPQPVPSPVCVMMILSIGKVAQDATTARFLQSVWMKLVTITARPRSFNRWIASRFSCRIWWAPSTGYKTFLLEILCLSRTLW